MTREILENFLEEAAWEKGYRASIADDLQHDGDGGAGVQRPQHHRFTRVPDQPLPALLCYTWGNQGGEGSGSSLSPYAPPRPLGRTCGLSLGGCRTPYGWHRILSGQEAGPGCYPPHPCHLQHLAREPLGEENPRVPMSCDTAQAHPSGLSLQK